MYNKNYHVGTHSHTYNILYNTLYIGQVYQYPNVMSMYRQLLHKHILYMYRNGSIHTYNQTAHGNIS